MEGIKRELILEVERLESEIRKLDNRQSMYKKDTRTYASLNLDREKLVKKVKDCTDKIEKMGEN